MRTPVVALTSGFTSATQLPSARVLTPVPDRSSNCRLAPLSVIRLPLAVVASYRVEITSPGHALAIEGTIASAPIDSFMGAALAAEAPVPPLPPQAATAKSPATTNTAMRLRMMRVRSLAKSQIKIRTAARLLNAGNRGVYDPYISRTALPLPLES